MQYEILHLHSCDGSVGDSIIRVKALAAKLSSLGMKTAAVTDHGSLANIYSFSKVMQDKGIKPILGCEAYVVEDNLEKDDSNYHLVLLARTQEGFSNLLALSANASTEGFYYKPRTDHKNLRKYGKGLIALSACVGGNIPKLLLTGKLAEADQLALFYASVFDAFYLELQPGDFQEQKLVNEQLLLMHERLGIPIVATNDVHYLNEEDWFEHDLHVKLGRKGKVNAEGIEYPDKCYWVMPPDRFHAALVKTGVPSEKALEAMQNSVIIAEQCHSDLFFDVKMPLFHSSKKAEQFSLRRTCYAQLQTLSNQFRDLPVYQDRLDYELSVIQQLGFSGYFLLVKDFLDYARSQNILVGYGRGSVAGSLVAYLLRITAVDPLKYGLLFERFLSIQRPEAPDIDMDYEALRRDEMFTYVRKKYGDDHCALISTYGIRKAKGALRDTARGLHIDLEIADKAAKLIPDSHYTDDGDKETNLTIAQCLDLQPELKEMSLQYPEWFKLAQALEGLPSTTSVHAAGTLVSPVPLQEYLPLIRSNKEGMLATSLTKKTVETAGAIKFDFLGLKTLDMIHEIEQMTGYAFDVYADTFDDPAVWSLIGSSCTAGLFQLGSYIYKKRLPRLSPHSIDELAAVLALLRGPCISCGLDESYMQIVEGKKEIESIHPLYDSVTKDTKGILLYQEQLMQFAVAFGFTIEEGYVLTKACSKKNQEKMASFHGRFLEKGLEKGVPADVLDRIWEIVKKMAAYSFNKSHAVGYALLSYATAFYKHYFPAAFYVALLNNAYGEDAAATRKRKVNEAMKEIRAASISFLPLSLRDSSSQFTLEDGRIRIGLCAVKGMSASAIEVQSLVGDTLKDLIAQAPKKTFNKTCFVHGIFSGAFDFYGKDRKELYQEFCAIRKEKELETIKVGKECFAPANYRQAEMVLMGTTFPVSRQAAA